MKPSRPLRRQPLTIAHRGASGYLPEHSLAAKAMAYAQGADFIEQDVVASRDDVPVVLHDIHIDRVSDVAARFPDRAREDGRFYARDFSVAELKRLRLSERRGEQGNAVFPDRFPVGETGLTIPTLQEELQLIAGLNRATGRAIGVYPEIKKPAWHHAEGVDLARLVLDALSDAGFNERPEQVFLQCFDLNENMRLKTDVKVQYPLIQLLGDDRWGESETRYGELLAPDGLVPLKGVVAGIGPWIPQLYTVAEDGTRLATGLVDAAHALGLQVHPYTARRDALPAGFATFHALHDWLLRIGIDGLFTDFPDQTRDYFSEWSVSG